MFTTLTGEQISGSTFLAGRCPISRAFWQTRLVAGKMRLVAGFAELADQLGRESDAAGAARSMSNMA